jgi:hypothetical protein
MSDSSTSALRQSTPAGTNVLFSDTFAEDPINNPAPAWKVLSGSWAVCAPSGSTHDYCQRDSTSGISTPVVTGAASWTNYHVDANLSRSATAGGVALLARMEDATHFYQFELRSSVSKPQTQTWDLSRYDGSWHTLTGGIFSSSLGAFVQIQLVLSGSSISVSSGVNNIYTLLGKATDTSYATGGVGLRTFGAPGSAFGDVSVTANGSSNPTPSPTAPPIASGGNHVIAGCSIFPGDPRFHRDIVNAAVASNSSSIIASSASLGHFGSLEGAGKYLLHVQPNADQPVTTIRQQLSYHAFPDKWPIAGYKSQAEATGPAGDRGMEIIQLGTTDAGGCTMWDAYNVVYLGQYYPASPNFSGYSGCKIDPSKNMPTSGGPCNSTSGWGGVSIDGGVFPEEVTGTGPGWSHSPTHALVIEIPQSSRSPLLNSTTKVRLRSSFPEPENSQAKFIVDSLKTYGAFTVENGCCFNIARTWEPQSGDADISFGSVDPIVESISITDFSVMASND